MLIRVDQYEVDVSYVLGSGTYGRVYSCRKIGTDQYDMCCKAICIEQLKRNPTEYEKTLREVKILEYLRDLSGQNENVVQFYHTSKVIFENQEHLLIFMEKCDKDLKEYLKNNSLSIEGAVGFLKQIINGYRICYENNIMHRDLKPANILLKGKVCKLTDFGEGKIVKHIDRILQQTKTGTPIYQSPQMYRPSDEDCSTKTDIYSLGIIFYEMLYAAFPFQVTRPGIENFHKQLMQNSFKPPTVNHQNQKINLDILDLLMKMIKYKDSDRISWKELFEHPLIKIEVKEQNNLKQKVINQIQIQQSNQLKQSAPIPQINISSSQRLLTIQQPRPITSGQANAIPKTQNIIPQIQNGGVPQNQNGTVPQIQFNQIQFNQITNSPIQLNNQFISQNQQLPHQNTATIQISQPKQQVSNGIPNIPNSFVNQNTIKTVNQDSQSIIKALKFLKNFISAFKKYGIVNPKVHERVDEVVKLCKLLITSICQQILLRQQNQCDEQFQNLKNTEEICQTSIFVKYSQQARQQAQMLSLQNLGAQLKQIIEFVYQDFPYDKNKTYKESYINFKIDMKLIITSQVRFTDIQQSNFRNTNESYLN